MESVQAARKELRDRLIPAIARDGLARVSTPGNLPGRLCEPPAAPRPLMRPHSQPEICCFLQGRSSFWVENRSIEFTAPHVLLLPPNVPHVGGGRVARTSSPGKPEDAPFFLRADFFHFGATITLFRQVAGTTLMAPDCAVADRRVLDAVDALVEELARKPECHDVIAHGLLLEILGRLARAPLLPEVDQIISALDLLADSRPLPPLLSEAVHYLVRHFDQPLTLARIAAALQVSPSTLGHEFKSATGRSVMAYLTEVRIAAAKSLLQLPVRVSGVSEMVGFSDPAYFSRVFHARVGMSASDYRAQHHP
ncbi:MAG: helix-turn-helix transcriptional regulator [Armatimonadetes bacterium]|nr:helix-turn-helix transcriptional regulator [Armatimonadota bacterium]